MYSKRIVLYAMLFSVAVSAVSCATSRKATRLRKEAPVANLVLPDEKEIHEVETFASPKQDTLQIVDLDGHKMTLMNAIKDEDGNMVANEVLQAAVVTARFRNVAERHGKIDLEFQVKVPKIMLEQSWQTRFYPDMFMLGDSTRLDMLILTGKDYRKAQLKGYQRYNKFLASIVSDTTRYINIGLLENFLQRNIPQVYAYKYNQNEVSEEEFASCFGVTEKEAIQHYTNKIATYLNNRRKSMMGAMYRKYVKAPIITEGVRIDTVFVNVDGDFCYNYIQTIETKPKLKKVEILLSGEIYEQDLLLYNIPYSSPLTFYISSLSSFADNTEKYLTKTIKRRVEANTACNIEFKAGKADIVPELGNNSAEIDRIKGNILEVVQNEKFDLDSITVSSFASPEGKVALNNSLSKQRAESACAYFSKYLRHVQDSIKRVAGYSVVVGDDMIESAMEQNKVAHISFKSRSGGEDWETLGYLVNTDTTLTRKQIDRYFAHADIRNLDERELKMKGDDSYKYIHDNLYPKLRSVKFNFYLHRKGMVEEEVQTTELDTIYAQGVQAIRDRDYTTACTLLGSYQDFNSAVAYVAADRNMSALAILEPMERTAVVNYMLALCYSRLGDEQKAVQCYVHSCAQDHSFVNRGNLDPEIAALIKKYGLNKQEDDFNYSF